MQDHISRWKRTVIKDIKTYHKCLQSALLAETFGITKDPTSNYMIVMKYQYLDRHNGILSWKDIIDILQGIARGLERIHIEGKIHRNLHGGNLFIEDDEILTDARISDVGLYGPCYYHENKNSGQVYGVLPYIALVHKFCFLQKKNFLFRTCVTINS
ncbi:21656_t:CDS:2 [Rhizophagus irregularis]|nr:21656_t:CDS:2 [Rhizophagus irregularis]